MIELLLTGTLTLCILETPKGVHLQTVKTQIRVKGAHWLSGRVLAPDQGATGLSLTSVTALWSLSMTHLS